MYAALASKCAHFQLWRTTSFMRSCPTGGNDGSQSTLANTCESLTWSARVRRCMLRRKSHNNFAFTIKPRNLHQDDTEAVRRNASRPVDTVTDKYLGEKSGEHNKNNQRKECLNKNTFLRFKAPSFKRGVGFCFYHM